MISSVLPATLGEALDLARGRIDRADARVLLREAAGVSASTLVAYPERALPSEQARRFVAWLARREAGEPVAYLLGEREFFGHVFRVSTATLIPRPDTELLVERALAVIEGIQAPKVLDLGTGSGAIAVSIALARRDAKVFAVDRSEAALAVARENATRLGADLFFLAGSWFEPVQDESFDCIVSNPPYIAEANPHLSQGDLRFEPPGALASGPDGLDDIRHIVTEAGRYLKPEGCLLLEHGYDQAEAVRSLLSHQGFQVVQSWKDLAGIERVTGAQSVG